MGRRWGAVSVDLWVRGRISSFFCLSWNSDTAACSWRWQWGGWWCWIWRRAGEWASGPHPLPPCGLWGGPPQSWALPHTGSTTVVVLLCSTSIGPYLTFEEYFLFTVSELPVNKNKFTNIRRNLQYDPTTKNEFLTYAHPWVTAEAENLSRKVALLPGKFLSVRYVFGNLTEKSVPTLLGACRRIEICPDSMKNF